MSSINKRISPELNHLESISSHPDNAELLGTLKTFSDLLKSCGIERAVSSPDSLMALSQLTAARKKEIQIGFQLNINFCLPVLKAAEGTAFHVSHETEKECLKNVLDYHDFEVSDEFWKTLDNDQVIEIYGQDMKQVYRGLNFYKYTGYSLLDVSVFEWFVLWERPKMVVQMMMEQSQNVLEHDLKCFKFQIPRHVLRETKDTGLNADFVPRACMLEFQHCGVVKNSKDPLKKGFICTSLGEIIAEGEEALNINFV